MCDRQNRQGQAFKPSKITRFKRKLALDLRGGLTADASEWAVTVLPDRDHYIFLAQDYRFGIISNCADRTICVFGRELLAAIHRSPPAILFKTSWTFEERREMFLQWSNHGWKSLSSDDRDEVWDRFITQFQFDRGKAGIAVPAIAEPIPSQTWKLISAIDQSSVDELTAAILRGLKAATTTGERLHSLDASRWYENYTFDPHLLDSTDRSWWATPIYPDNCYTIILSPDFSFGLFGNPFEQSICVFGERLLQAVGNDLPLSFSHVIRRDGLPAT